MSDATPAARLGHRVLGAILLAVNVLALAFSALMLMWAVGQLGYEGERWGLIGVLILGGIGLIKMYGGEVMKKILLIVALFSVCCLLPTLALAQFERQGLIHVRRGLIEIVDVQALQEAEPGDRRIRTEAPR